ncbi:MAG: ABC transporter permease [Clostridiales bacterium]|nr:ABC transporter permease [Clostridiales bacterium]
MGKYILKRLLLMIPVILGVVILVFTILYITPGDPAQVILGDQASDAQLNALRHEMGLDQPYIVRLGQYLYQVFFHFDFGESYITGVSITEEILARFPVTLTIAVATIVISLGIGIPLGVYAATHQNSVGDYGTMGLALVGTSMPGFWLALMAILIFSYKLGWLPAYGLESWQSWILPILANAFAEVAVQARQTRSSMLEVLNSDYIVMAKSKGLKKWEVIYKHALPNALIPIITIAGTSFGTSLGGAIIIEAVFSIPGIGTYLMTGVNNRDYFVVQGGVTILAIAFCVIMLLSDLVIAAFDSRIRAQFVGGGRKRRIRHGKA